MKETETPNTSSRTPVTTLSDVETENKEDETENEERMAKWIISPSIRKLLTPETIKKFKESRAKAKERIKPLEEKLGIKIVDEVFQVAEALDELEECDCCTGEPCRKKKNQYFQNVFTIAYGKLHIAASICPIMEQRKIKSACRKADIPPKYAGKNLKDYEPTVDNERAIKGAKWFIKEKPRKGLYLYGGCGTGKTFLAAIIAQEYLKGFNSVEFGDVPTLLDEIKRTFNSSEESAADVLSKYCTCDLLVLDDLGVGQITDWNVGQLYQIINARYNTAKPIIVTSNFDLEGLNKRLTIKDDFTARRITSRLAEMCVEIFFGTKDRRR